jgi:predicted Zn-dependent protease
VQGIWQPLLAAARVRGELPLELDAAYAWEVMLLKDRSVNAFALPGAYLGLHLGLVAVVTSRDELASVLSHELSHVTQRHIARSMERQSAQTPWLIGAMILGILAASKSPDGASAMIIGGQAASVQSHLNFSRDMEREADRIGFGVATQAGYAPQGFVTMFDKLGQASRLNDAGGFPYLRTHPLSTERMADMQSRISEQSGAAMSQSGNKADFVQAMVAARARVLSNFKVDDLRSWATEAQADRLAQRTPVQQAGALYGAALAALKLRELFAAEVLQTRLRALVQSDAQAARMVRLLEVEAMLALQKSTDANSALAKNKPIELMQGMTQKGSRAELMLRAEAQILAGQATGAIDALQLWVADHPRDAMAWQWLASAYAAQGNNLSAVRAEAEVSLAQMDYAAAQTRFRAAQDLVRRGSGQVDHIEASIIDSRARMVESALREQALQR